MDWKAAAERIAPLYRERCQDIRRVIPAEEIKLKAVESLRDADLESPQTHANMDVLMELINQINLDHVNRIEEMAGGFASVVDRSGSKDMKFDFVGEEGSAIIVLADHMRLAVEKDMVLKILALGRLP